MSEEGKADEEKSENIFDPNTFKNDGKTYLILKKYESYDDNKDVDPEPVVLDTETEELYLDHARVLTIKNFNVLTKTETLSLRNNLISKIEGISQLSTLTSLELYDNQITKIENLDSLVNLR